MHKRGGLPMQEFYERLRKQPSVDRVENDTGLNTWFLLDKIRGEKTLPSFYKGSHQGLIASIESLLLGTEHTPLFDVSPLLIKLNHTNLSQSLHQIIQEERSGLFIQSHTEQILPHLQYLFTMQSEQQGKVYVRYYDPICWTSLMLSLSNQQNRLWGDLEKVYAVLPAKQQQNAHYMVWSKPQEITSTPTSAPIILTHEFTEINKDVHLLYFFQQQIYQLNPNITDNQLSRVLINLKVLNDKGIERVDYLQRLIKPCLEQDDFAMKPEVQSILNQDILAYKKVNALEQLV